MDVKNKKKLILISSGYPTKKNPYRSPYIQKYYNHLSSYYQISLVYPKFKGLLGIIECNLYTIGYMLLGKNLIYYSHSAIHSFFTPLLLFRSKSSYILNVHGVEVFQNNIFYRQLISIHLKLLIKFHKLNVISPSNSFLKKFCETYRIKYDNALINYSLGLDCNNNKYRSRDEQQEVKVLYVGNSTYLKGYDLFIKTVERNPDVKFFCFPNVFQEAKKMKNLNVQKNYMSYEKYQVLSNYDYLFHPSRFESLGLTVMEALYCGLNCYVLDLKVYKEIKAFFPGIQTFGDIREIKFNKSDRNIIDRLPKELDTSYLSAMTMRYIEKVSQ